MPRRWLNYPCGLHGGLAGLLPLHSQLFDKMDVLCAHSAVHGCQGAFDLEIALLKKAQTFCEVVLPGLAPYLPFLT